MTFEDYFTTVWVLVMGYVVLGNYLYFAKVLPALGGSKGKVGHSFLPSGQLKHIDEYLKLIDKNRERPWFYSYLRHIRLVTLVLILLMLPAFIKALGTF